MKKLLLAVACIALVGLAPCAYAAQVEVHGTLDNRMQVYTDQQNFFKHSGTSLDGTEGQFADFKYRIWTEMATDDNAVKGVFGIEVGGVRFGQSSTSTSFSDSNGDTGTIAMPTDSKGGDYSGDGVNIETRWAYTDFMLGNGRMKIGLQPWTVNSFVWKETAAGITYGASAGSVDYEVGWARGKEHFNTTKNDHFIEDADALMARVNFGIGEGSKAGVFLLYQTANPSASTPAAISSNDYYMYNFGDVDMNIYTLGVDGKFQTSGPLFLNWDVMYQTGKIENATFTDSFSGTTSGAFHDFDLNAYFAHVDVGVKLGKVTLTYTGWYASGDDKADDDNFDAFLATDIDRSESIIFMEGGYVNDNYYTDRSYLADKGLFLNRVGVDFQATDKTKVGAALLYLQTAEDIKYTDTNGVARSSSDLGFELDGYVSYQMYKNLELALNAGYLLSGDAMDVFEPAAEKDGSSDENIFRSTARVLYKF
jgi:hypothetical protein